MLKNRIGIYAGSFDPIHDGHLAAAKAAIQQLNLATLYFVVEPRPRYKQGVKAFEHRSEMVRLAVENQQKFKQIIIDEPHCTTEDTIPMLKNRFPNSELFLLMGDDVVRRIADWSQVSSLVDSVTIAVFHRTAEASEIERVFAKLEVVSGKKPKYELVKNKPITCSSSAIKKQLKSAEMPECLHSKVYSYIKKQNLYGSSGLVS